MANLVYRNSEASLWFVPTGAAQAEDASFDVTSLASGAGRQSNDIDLGVAAVSRVYEWRAFCQFATTPVLGEVIHIYLKTLGDSGSATDHPDNDDGTTDAAVSAIDKLVNLHFLGSIVVDQAASNTEMVASGTVEINARSVQVVFWNATVDALTSDDDENGFVMTPVPSEIQ